MPGKKLFVHQKGMTEQHMMGHTKNELGHSYPNLNQSYTIKIFLFALAPRFPGETELIEYRYREREGENIL